MLQRRSACIVPVKECLEWHSECRTRRVPTLRISTAHRTSKVAATFRTSEIRLGGSLFVCMSVGASCKPTLPFFSLREILGKEKISFIFSLSSLCLFCWMSSGFLFSSLLGLFGSDIGRLVHRRRCIPLTLHCAECYHVSPPVFVSRSTRLQTPAVCPIRAKCGCSPCGV